MGPVRREWKGVYALLVALTLLFFALFLFFMWRSVRDSSLDREKIPLTLLENGRVFWTEEKAEDLPGGLHTVTVRWQGAVSADVTVICGGKAVAHTELSAGEEKDFSLTVFGNGAALTVVAAPFGGIATAFLTCREDLGAALNTLPQGGDVVCVRPVDLQSISTSVPIRWFGSFTFDSFWLDTEYPGIVSFAPVQPFSADLTLFAPACDVFLHGVMPHFDRGEDTYFLRVRRLNGKACFTGTIPVSSEEQIKTLFDQSSLPRLLSGDTLAVTAPVTLTRDYAFPGLLSFSLEAPVNSNGHAFYITSREEGDVRVNVADGTAISADLFALETPLANMTWNGGIVPAITVAQRLWNVSSYNGTAPELGGRGTGVPTLILRASENEILQEDVSFSVVGNTLIGTLPYQTTAAQAARIGFDLSSSVGTAKVEGEAITPGASVVTTDDKGEERRYAVVFVRTAKKIPVVYLETDGGAAISSRTQYVSGLFAMDGEESDLDSVPLTHVRIRGRGNSTWKWEKKPYKLHFDGALSLFGLPAAEEWALLANYADKSLMRNRLGLVLASTLSFDYTPTQVLVDVFLNGEYQGVYSLGEHLEAGSGRVEVRHNPRAADCGYFLEAGGVVSGVDVRGMNYFHAGLVKFVLIKDPPYNTLTSVQFHYIQKYFMKANEAVKAGEGWEEYLDLDTLVDWMILTELSNNTDCSWRRSTFFIKSAGEKVKMGSVWDFDLAFGNFSKDVQDYSTWASTNEEDDYVGTTWSTYLLNDPVFRKAFRDRWASVRDELLKTAMAEINDCYAAAAPSAEENFIRWQILGRKVAFERKDTVYYTTYESQIRYLKDFLTRRAAWIDEAVAAWEIG